MKRIKSALSLAAPLTLWLLISVFLWGFVFLQITDAPRAEKIVLSVDARIPDEAALAARLEEGLGAGVRMVKARQFTYAMFDEKELTSSDLFVVPASHAEGYRDWFAPLPADLRDAEGLLCWDGKAWGVPVRGAAGDFILYTPPGGEEEAYYLFFGKASLHVSGLENAVDNEAVSAARRFLALP